MVAGNILHMVSLVGGRRNRSVYPVSHPKGYWPDRLYLIMPLSIEEAEALRINENMGYRWPDEVYRKDTESLGHQYIFERVVHYDPRKTNGEVGDV